MIFVVDIEGAQAARWLDALGGERRDFPNGVHFATNPVRSVGSPPRYWFPKQLTGKVSLVSPTGLVQTDPAYLERAILPFAHWTRAGRPDRWLHGVYRVMMDAGLRGYPLWLGDSERMATEPKGALEELGAWLGRACDGGAWGWPDNPERAVELLDHEEALLDEVHERVVQRAAFEPEFLDRIDDALATLAARAAS